MKLKQLSARLTTRQRALLYATLIIGLIAAGERLIYQPIMTRLKELDQEILLKEGQLRKNFKNLAAREAVLTAYSEAAVHAVAPESDEEKTAGLLTEIEGLAAASGLLVVNVKPKPVTKIDIGRQYPLEIEVEGEMVSLIKFLNSLYNSKHILRVKQLRLAPKGGRTNQLKGHLLIHETVIQ